MCQHLHRDNTLEVRSVSALAVDFDGNVWFGGWDRGDLVRFDGRRWRTYTTYDGSAGEGNSVFDITAAPNGDLWVGVPRYAYHLDGDEWTIYGVEDGLPGFGVSAIAVAPDGTLWFGGLEPLGDGDNGASVVSFDGATWTAYGIEDGLGDSNVNDIAVTPDGVVWIGTRHGISRFDGERWISDYADFNVSDVEVDAAGGVWFATDEGVLRLDDQTDLTYTEEDGLPNTEVDALALAPDGTPWAGTRDGIAHFRDGTWTSYPIGER
jgi:ligand-binding sensor domain-containing protein